MALLHLWEGIRRIESLLIEIYVGIEEEEEEEEEEEQQQQYQQYQHQQHQKHEQGEKKKKKKKKRNENNLSLFRPSIYRRRFISFFLNYEGGCLFSIYSISILYLFPIYLSIPYLFPIYSLSVYLSIYLFHYSIMSSGCKYLSMLLKLLIRSDQLESSSSTSSPSSLSASSSSLGISLSIY